MYDSLVLSGGGIKGILTLGFLHTMFEQKQISHESVLEYAGTSIGSVICLLLICGYTPYQIFEMVYTHNFFDINDGNIFEMVTNYGFMTPNKFVGTIENYIVDKFGHIPSLFELYQKTKKVLYICAVNITNSTEEKISYRTHPNLSCLEAVSISCNIPIIFHKKILGGDIVGDGGLVNNYPWNYISNQCQSTLGILLCGNGKNTKLDSFSGYIYRIMNIPISHLCEIRLAFTPSSLHTVRLEYTKSHSFQFNITEDEKLEMFMYGCQFKDEKEIKLYVKDWEYEECGWDEHVVN